MAKRFTATDIWGEDWFLDMPNEYKLFWYYMLSNCDHAGLFKVNLRSFCGLLGVNLTSKVAIELFNHGKQRIRVIKDSVWLIEEFFVYQYGEKFNPKNRVHESIGNVYKKYNIQLTSIRGLIVPNDGVKDKDKDKDKDKEDNIEGKYWFLKFYHSTYENYKSVFNGQSCSKESFNEWKCFIDFIYEKKYEDVFECKFISPHSFEIIVKENHFTKDKWDKTLRALLSTGIKQEHDLFFRIPTFMDFSQKGFKKEEPKSDYESEIERKRTAAKGLKES